MKYLYSILVLILVLMRPFAGMAQNLISSKHNLSTSGTGTIKSTSENEVCIFCHTPHNARQLSNSPLWNRNDPGSTYTMYTSSTVNYTTVARPDGTSLMCLSCHDGTVALGSVSNSSTPISFGSLTTLPTGKTNLGTNLADDHPISFTYDAGLAALDGQILAPTSILAPVSLDVNSKMQCTSCHDAHDNTYTNFLLNTNKGSALCYSCHNKSYWGTSSHSTSTKGWNGSGVNPWANTTYKNVADNACENCHTPHNAGGPTRILNFLNEEDNCLDCHNGNVATKNIQTELTKTYKHNVYAYTGVHDDAEAALVPSGSVHVECVDCHNPHAVQNTTAYAPNVNGFVQDVKGVDVTGAATNPVQYQYQICYRCHSDNPSFTKYITRYRGIGNTRVDFSTSNVSYHPVEDVGKNAAMASLVAPYTSSSKIYCTDCHASDGVGSPAGPHGSNNIAILKAAYDTTRFPMLGPGWSATIPSKYAICFQCHSNSAVSTIHTNISGGHFMQYVGCATCHDPHGYDGTLGVAGGSVASAFQYLINFDTTVVKPNAANGKLIDIPGGKCYFVCHNPSNPTGGTAYGNYAHQDAGSNFTDAPTIVRHGSGGTTTVRVIKK